MAVRQERETQDANEKLRRRNEAEAARRAALMADGAAVRPAGDLSTAVSATEFAVKDVFTITGRRGDVIRPAASA